MTKDIPSTGPAQARAGRKARKNSAAEEPLRLRRVAVERLFGLYDHEILLHVEDRVTILHGPNGVGKTALLKLIAGLFTGRYEDFEKYPFASFVVQFVDDSAITVEPKKRNGRHEHAKFALAIRYSDGSGKGLQSAEVTREEPGSGDQEAALTPVTSYLFGLGGSHRSTSLKVSYTEAAWLPELRKRLQAHVIEAQRLLRLNRASPFPWAEQEPVFLAAVHDCAGDLGVRIKNALARYGSWSQALDQSFPQRLLKTSRGASLSPADLKTKMKDLDERRTVLQEIGLLDPTSETPFDVASLDELAPEQTAVMALYVDDTRQKLAVLENLAQRISILLENVNSKFKHKSIRIDQEKGFVALGHDGSQLDPDSLSSGEQHELVLLYDLLFRVRAGTLVLIDEPELSLHVGWQKRFLPDLLEIVKIAELDVIVATHSPFIVGDRSDLMVPLAAEIDA